MKADVVLVGAGVSGVPAAVAAARAGAKTLLLEQHSSPGGTMSASLGFPICGLFENDISNPPRLLNEGLSAELFSAISSDVPGPVFAMGKVYVCRCPLLLFESVYTHWLDKENLTVCFGISELSLEMRDNRIHALSFLTADGKPQTCVAKQVLDCTGAGAVVEQSGAKQIIPDQLPLAGFTAQLGGVTNHDLLAVKVPYILRRAVEAGELPAHCTFTTFSMQEAGSALCKFNLPDQIPLAEAKQTARDALACLKKELPEFSSATLNGFSPRVLSREGARLKGQTVLSAEDVRSGRSFEDAVARGAWPMEYWNTETGPEHEYIENGFSYDIPLRALRSENIKNLWAAGRAISADSAALASARVMGTAIATGEAAGGAAARESL